MMNTEDEWVVAALSDDSLVAELLSRLTQSSKHPPPPPQPFIRLPCVWGHRQRRSKPAGKDSSTRRSPTTPLSWSGASEGGDYSNSTSSRPPSDLSRSNKEAYGYGDDVPNNKVSSSSSKKKKSFAELKEEESLLLKERVGLKRELASLNSTLKQQRVRSERLKRIKIDLNADNICTTSCRAEASSFLAMEAAPSCYSTDPRKHHASTKIDTHNKAFFALPDLNMMPSEEEMVSGFS